MTLPSPLELEGATEFVPVVLLELEGSALELEGSFGSLKLRLGVVKEVTDSWGRDRVSFSSLLAPFDDFFLPLEENLRARGLGSSSDSSLSDNADILDEGLRTPVINWFITLILPISLVFKLIFLGMFCKENKVSPSS